MFFESIHCLIGSFMFQSEGLRVDKNEESSGEKNEISSKTLRFLQLSESSEEPGAKTHEMKP